MTDLRDARAALLRRWHRDMSDDFSRALPKVLDDLERIDREAEPELKINFSGMSEEEFERFKASSTGFPTSHAVFAAEVHPEPPSLAEQVERTKPQPRRRTTRKES